MMWKLDNILNWLYPFFFFALPFQTRWIVRDELIGGSMWEYGRVSVYGFDVVLACICLFALFSLSNKEIRERGEIKGWMVGVGALTVVYELFVSLDPLLSAVMMARVTLAIFAGWFLVRNMDVIILRRALAAFVFAMALSAGFGAAQFFTQNSLIGSKWLGLSRQDPSVLGVSVIEAQGGRWLRAHGTMPHPNVLGGFSSIGLALYFMLVTVRLSGKKDTNSFFQGRFFDFCSRVFAALAPLVLIAGVITSASRAALIAVAAAAVVMFRIALRGLHWRMLIIPLAGMAAGTLITLIVALPILTPRLTARGRLESVSIERRLSALEESAKVFKAYGILGTGLGSSTAALQKLFPEKKIWEQQPVHNIPLLLILELGLGGIAIIVVILFTMRFKFPISNFQFPNKPQIPNSKFQIPVVICWLMLVMLDHYLWTLPSGLYLSVFLWCIFIFSLQKLYGLDNDLSTH